MDRGTLVNLETRIDALIAHCEQLKQENKQLRTEQVQLKQERTRLVEKTELAKTRINAMIERLKALDPES
ncbi:TIGR02449 family protein [Candidatus Venteria ishoeyi]|uniref:Cell division protein ZapB n=1 Tax=Candidatus Venteria ishoeyi TaxID=1899563 RepID=A0A1H6FCY7_9GAMM|nr:TIGR02449 family protein [Candidatus Venteria ishoeyi]MDM8545038.1 TIGR02449 family protein [Candidatus Venteria ishoeyi]SEH07026.1 Uncharacterised protein [Candidatus Venteria ishoeyi]